MAVTFIYTGREEPHDDDSDTLEPDDSREFGMELGGHIATLRAQWAEQDEASGIEPDSAEVWFRGAYEASLKKAFAKFGPAYGTFDSQLPEIQGMAWEMLEQEFRNDYGCEFHSLIAAQERALNELRMKYSQGWETPSAVRAILDKARSTLGYSERSTYAQCIGMLNADSITRWNESLEMIYSLAERAQKKAAAEERKRELVMRRAAIMEVIPPLYREPLDEAKMKNPAATAGVLAYHPGSDTGRGLFIHGETGSGKTRAMCAMLIQRAMKYRDLPFELWTATDLKRQLGILRGEELSVFIKKRSCVTILAIDDISIARLTPAYAENLHSILEARTNTSLPTVMTSQQDFRGLLGKLSGGDAAMIEEAKQIIRRIKDFSGVVSFNAP